MYVYRNRGRRYIHHRLESTSAVVAAVRRYPINPCSDHHTIKCYYINPCSDHHTTKCCYPINPES